MTDTTNDLRYRALLQSVRPGRAATLLCSEGEWQMDVLRLLECYSRTWGGDGNGILACSSSWQISEAFWPLIGAFDADLWAVFQRNLRGLKMADPTQYEAIVNADVDRWVGEHPGPKDEARALIESEHYLSQPWWGWPTPDWLNERVRRWHSPSSSMQLAVRGVFRADEPPPAGLVDMRQLTSVPERVNTLDTSAFPLCVQLLVAARTGGLSPSHRDRLVDSDAHVEEEPVIADEDLTTLLEFAWTGQIDMASRRLVHVTASELGGASEDIAAPVFASPKFLAQAPLIQSRLGCDWFRRWHPDSDEKPVVVMCGNSAEDFAYAFTRQRVVGQTYWFPGEPTDDLDDFDRALRETFVRVLHTHATAPIDNPTILLSSLTLDASQLQLLLVELQSTPWGSSLISEAPGGLTVSVVDPADLPVRRDMFLVDEVHYPRETFEPFLGVELARTLDIPLPSKAEGMRPESCRWQVDVEDPVHVLPARWLLSSTLGAKDDHAHWALRSSNSGISVDSHGRSFVLGGSPLGQMLVQVRLRYPTASEMFECLLSGVGGTIEESDKGSYSRRMIDLWGSFDSLATDLATLQTRQLLLSWVNVKSDGSPGIVTQQRRHLRLIDVMKITGLRVDAARDLLDRYIHREIVSRGLLFTCGMCNGTSFYRLEDMGTGFRCQRCRQINEILRNSWKGAREPIWFYALDEVVFQGLGANAHVPLLALARISKSSHSFLYMPEGKVHVKGRSDIEIDLWAIADGKIIIGEAKIQDRIERTALLETSRCEAFSRLALDLTADQFVMATASSSWRNESRELAERIIGATTPIQWMDSVGE